MNLHELRKIIAESDRSDWRKITCWGHGSGPSYRADNAGGELRGSELLQRAHANVAIYIPDIDISIAWGMDRSSDERDLSFEWNGKFPDPQTTVHLADVFYRGSLVDRVYQAAVDGGRAYLPIGSSRLAKDSPAEMVPEARYEVVTSQWETDFARLVHDFEHVDSFDSYLRRAGHIILPDAAEDMLSD